MTPVPHPRLIYGMLILFALKGFSQTEPTAEPLVVTQKIEYLLEDYCWKCHDSGTQKGDIRLDNLDELGLDERLDRLNRMHEQIHLGHMPPKEEEDRPNTREQDELIGWITKDLQKYHASKLEAKLRMPAYGNYVNHLKLFSGDHADLKASTPDRRWLISEYIFTEKFNRLLQTRASRRIGEKDKNGRSRPVPIIGDTKLNGVNLTNPFLLPSESGVRYYDTTTLDGGHLLTMITNAREVSGYLMSLAERDHRNFPAVAEIMQQEWNHRKTLSEREQFLGNFIDRIISDIYDPSQHQALLPRFVPAEVELVEFEEGVKKAPIHAAILGRDEMKLMFHTMLKHQDLAKSDAELIQRCEREWFNFGHTERKISMRLIFLHGYLDQWREQIIEHNYAQKNKAPVFKARSDEEMAVIRETILKHRQKGDTYKQIISKCMTDWTEGFRQERVATGLPTDDKITALIEELFLKILERSPDTEESTQYFTLAQDYIQKLGTQPAIEKMIETLILNSDFVYRSEFGQGEPDEHGRRMMSPRDAAYALAYALTDSSPDEELMQAAKDGRLNSREDYLREVRRMLARRDQHYLIDSAVEQLQVQSFTNLPIRKLRFFREFFGYPNLMPIFKDDKRFGGSYKTVTAGLVMEADMLIEHILKSDQQVFEKLLTTDKYYVFHSGDNEAMADYTKSLREVYDYFRDENWQEFTEKDFEKHTDFLKAHRINKVGRGNVKSFQKTMASIIARFDKGQQGAVPYVIHHYQGPTAMDRSDFKMRYEQIVKCYDLDLLNWDYPVNQPARIPNRAGILTHPAWLIAHSRNTETDPIHRGKWVREKLLAGAIPDVPITVDAVVPEDHTKTMRTRLAEKTEEAYCWKCHQHMNPLGYTFEMYDDFGRYRMDEFLEHPDNLVEKRPDKGEPHEDLRNIFKTLPVTTDGQLTGTGDPALDGELKDAIDLTQRLAKSERVRQSIIRHAFRYFMGRNETLSDSRTLIDADQAYLQSSGSFDAVIVSLLTSDSFIYRTAPKPLDP